MMLPSEKSLRTRDYIPDEIVSKILRKLPPKSLITCTAVCKSWRHLIRRSDFISDHLRHHHHHSPPRLLLQISRTYRNFAYTFPLPLHRDDDLFSPDSSLLFAVVPEGGSSVVGSIDGLVCISSIIEPRPSLIICNPSIRRYVRLPRPQCFGECYAATVALGIDSITGDYKIVRVSSLHEDGYGVVAPEVEVCSLATGSWRRLNVAVPVCTLFRDDRGTPHAFVGGVVHWAAKRRDFGGWKHFVLSFDFACEVFDELELPDSLNHGSGDSVSVIGGEGGDKLRVYFVKDGDDIYDDDDEAVDDDDDDNDYDDNDNDDDDDADDDEDDDASGSDNDSGSDIGSANGNDDDDESCSCEIWEMEVYDDEKSWSKVFSFEFSWDDRCLKIPAWGVSVVNVVEPPAMLCTRKNGEFLMLVLEAEKVSLYSLDIDNKRLTKLRTEKRREVWNWYAEYYTESLVLLNKPNGVVSY